jgi:hypothetical protein
MEDQMVVFLGHCVYFTDKCNILWPFGTFGGHLVYFSPSNPGPTQTCHQGDQIGRIFASWAVVNFTRFLENYKINGHFFPRHMLCINFLTKYVLGYILGYF